jgi:hypothetical protein
MMYKMGVLLDLRLREGLRIRHAMTGLEFLCFSHIFNLKDLTTLQAVRLHIYHCDVNLQWSDNISYLVFEILFPLEGHSSHVG